MTIMEVAEKWSLLRERDKPERLEEVTVGIELIKKAKEQCEDKIKTVIYTFELQTGLMVERIDIDREFKSIGFPSEKTIKIKAALDL